MDNGCWLKREKCRATKYILAPSKPPKKESMVKSKIFSSLRSQALANLQIKKSPKKKLKLKNNP